MTTADTSDYSHKFLITMPVMDGDYFEKTVIYVCMHDEQGALGLIINRPAGLTFGKLLSLMDLRGSKALQDETIIQGGPVGINEPMVIHTDDWQSKGTMLLQEELALTLPLGDGSAFYEIITAIAEGEGPRAYLVSVGYAGWGSGQLDRELSANAWVTCPYDRELLFDVPFEKRFQQACQNLGFDMDLMSRQGGNA